MSTRLHKLTAVASGVLLTLAAAQPAKAVDISSGNWEGSFASTFPVGAGWRMEERDGAKIGFTNAGMTAHGYEEPLRALLSTTAIGLRREKHRDQLLS